MTQVTAMLVMFVLYGVLPAAGLYLGYRGIKKVTAPKMLEYTAMPQLGYIPEKSLPVEVKSALEQLNRKGKKLRLIYGDTNNDGKIDDKDTVTETYIMIQNLMDRHIPQAVADYRRLHDLDVADGARADTTKIKHSDVTGKQALLEVLKTINTQFDDLLNASYHQDGQKLLATNRYLQTRFDQPNMDSTMQPLSNLSKETEAIESPTLSSTDVKNPVAEDIKR
ncbi:hypothetical protein SAMN05660405_01858 [Psychrobacter pacificensis]|uniref:Uncharacterized protein n=1 Tax=Psychrobacter pacificensis TaxID=112002 RepID=A0A1G6Z0F3_9GAMM|nr:MULTISPECIES: hypothetical protein [Psychrobacter]AOY44974.1 hypothetical protein AOT82_2595 [Psychrobacter sp. AntiMn-1]GLR28033.1 hypothetical protein GCM10007915_02710 [Psychrobacter pacificensis]SDD95355.1 hypothetical protein SAMN05660405_01858 [Psychrobacter pacificensis]